MAKFAVIGMGQLGQAVAIQLAQSGGEVIAIDTDPNRIEPIKDKVDRALAMDATDENALRASGVEDCVAVVLALGENQLEEAVLATMILRDLGVGRIISRAGSDIQGKVLERLGVSRVVYPERQIGMQIARQIISPTVNDLLSLADGTSVAELNVPKHLAGKTLGEIHLRREFGLNAVAVRHRQEQMADDGTVTIKESFENLPGPQTKLEKNDILVVVGADESIRKLAGS